MKISATQIDQWAETRESQSILPQLIRRLIWAVTIPNQINFPAGDSINQPGWDGEVINEYENNWVPKGRSFWECSCQKNVTKKANKDYKKRTEEIPPDIRANSTLVIVSARRWWNKKRWQSEKKKVGEWADIRVYDADDLEQ